MTVQAAPLASSSSKHNPIDAAQTFGVEIETYGATRARVMQAVADVVGGDAPYSQPGYGTIATRDMQGRVWKGMTDASLGGDTALQCEVVTPPLVWGDIDLLQRVVRAIRSTGAKINATCGIHIHIGVAGWNARQLVNLANLFNRQEDLIYHALNVDPRRTAQWCKKNDAAFIKRCATVRTLADLRTAWYNETNSAYSAQVHYHGSRYRGLNMHNIWYRPSSPTVEYRLFNGSLHAGEIKASIALVLAMANRAKTQTRVVAAHKPFDPACSKYDMRVFMIKLGLIGDAFENVRKHLTKHCQGDASFKNGRQAPTAAQNAATA
jgi:hypothetical protein